jgi:hypothetical protein
MSADEPVMPPGTPSIPLSTELRQAYQDLYDGMEAVIRSTTDLAVLEALVPMQVQVRNVLTKDNMYKLHANTELYEALQQQIDDTNEGLETLQKQITSIAAGFDEAGQVLAAINKVLTLIPGI